MYTSRNYDILSQKTRYNLAYDHSLGVVELLEGDEQLQGKVDGGNRLTADMLLA